MGSRGGKSIPDSAMSSKGSKSRPDSDSKPKRHKVSLDSYFFELIAISKETQFTS